MAALGRDHHEPATPALLGRDDLMLLEEPDCFPKDCPTDFVAPNELGLRAEALSHRPTVGDDLVLDSPRQEGRRLDVAWGFGG